MIKVIVNADDYGCDENRTRAIQRAFEMGAITATTAMANQPWFERAMREAKDRGFLKDVGLHFNITEGRPLSEEMLNCSLLCDADGYFIHRFHLTRKGRLYLPQEVRRAIKAEAKAQMRKYLDCGGTLMHLDSHHHVHTDFSVTSELYEAAVGFGFKSVRLSRNFGLGLSALKRCYKKVWNVYSSRRIPSRVRYFGTFQDFKACWQTLPSDAKVEVMVHPLYGCDKNLDLSAEMRDTTVLMKDELTFWNSLPKESVRLSHYDEI